MSEIDLLKSRLNDLIVKVDKCYLGWMDTHNRLKELEASRDQNRERVKELEDRLNRIENTKATRGW